MRTLILGGTVFLGRHVAAEALARGHELTLFTRGVHGVPRAPSTCAAIAPATCRRSRAASGTW